tara:strand:+ start:2884 stop:3978 length:1095 start_codon:yes stop_codon:yes gene_type:complete
MRAMIFGAGRMGQPTAWAMEKLGYEIDLVDQSEEALKKCSSILDQSPTTHLLKDITRAIVRPYPDVVISALPYHQNEIIANYCIKNGVRYCDLGGNEETSQRINEFAKKRGSKPIMTDLGLAPGLVNIITENLYKQIASEEEKNPERVLMMVGGLPKHADKEDHFNYLCSWSVDGLINEYTEPTTVLDQGVLTSVNALDGHQVVSTQSLGMLEAFYTSGGLSHSLNSLKDSGASNVAYKTLRWPGHFRTIKLLIDKCDLDRETLKNIFIKNCTMKSEEDCVLIYIAIDEKIQEMLVPPDQNFSAMQRCTGYGVACAASLIGEGVYDKEFSRQPIKHGDIIFEDFNSKMDALVVEDTKDSNDELQ